jgi:hypothetical protein
MVGYIVYTNTRSRAICDVYYNKFEVLRFTSLFCWSQPQLNSICTRSATTLYTLLVTFLILIQSITIDSISSLVYSTSLTCWLVVKLGTPQDRRLDTSDERQKGDCERTKGEREMSTLTPSFLTPH